VDNPDIPVLGTLKYLAYDRVVAISAAIRAQLDSEGLPAAKLRTIRSAVDADACQPTWTPERFLEEFGLARAHRVVAVVAQLIPRKGHALLLEAWPMIRNRCPDARLLVFGTGPLQAELENLAGLGGTVTFAGFRPDLRAFLGRVDLLVHPATREGLGIGLLEAQAAGVPVVAFAAGGVPEAVADRVTGVLVEPGNPAALAEAVIALLDEPNRRQRLGAAAADRIRAEFSPDRMVESHIELYREVLA
jgi:glycosyltransferase involved in cell wall biosynthesis